MDELLREAQKVYVRREEEHQKRPARIFVAAVREGRNDERREKSLREGQRIRGARQEVECYCCQKKGHLKRNCRKRTQDERMFQED